jgi:hypothetical protein
MRSARSVCAKLQRSRFGADCEYFINYSTIKFLAKSVSSVFQSYHANRRTCPTINRPPEILSAMIRFFCVIRVPSLSSPLGSTRATASCHSSFRDDPLNISKEAHSMFVHISIHYPIKGKEHLLIESMHRFGEAMKDLPGNISGSTNQDEATGRLVGMAIWESREHWEKAMPILHDAVKDDPFQEWEVRPPEIFHLNPV